jgi:hypothetical protein
MINSTPGIITTPTNNAAAFAEPPLTGWTWSYFFELGTSDYQSDVSGNVRITVTSSTFRSDLIVGQVVYNTLMGLVEILEVDSTSVLVAFPAAGFIPNGSELRLMTPEIITLTVAGRNTPIQVYPDVDGIRRFNPYGIIRRAFNYSQPAANATHWVTYKINLSATTYTALRTTGAPINQFWGVWPYVSYFQDALTNLTGPIPLPVQLGVGTINPQTFVLASSASQRVFIVQPSTPINFRVEGITLTTEPTQIPDWLVLRSQGSDVLIQGVVPNEIDSWLFEWEESGQEFNLNFTVPAGIYTQPYCVDRVGFTWLGTNGQWKTYYFDQERTEAFEQVNGAVVRTNNVQRWVGLSELRESVEVSERYLDNATKDWLKDFSISPAIYTLPNLERVYVQPRPEDVTRFPRKAESNSVKFRIVNGKKTPTIYEG